MENKKNISIKYNVILFVVLVISQSIKAILEYKNDSSMLIDFVFEHNPLIGTLVLISIFIFSSVVFVWVVKSFWDRFVSRIFQVRPLTINEAIGAMLFLSIVSLG